MPDLNPDFSAPGASALIQIVSWILGLGLIASAGALIACFITLGFKGFGNQNAQQLASKSVLWCALAVACLGGISGIFQFLVGFDLGIQ
ncbi:hypothetical protein ACFWHR_12150 [Leucobacter sp. NPDC058333]|uniref:hypothetical protein n=1 Tax=Leucobacter sp. NPDC058333 TaxID=3346450 RepID=UPI00365A11CC